MKPHQKHWLGQPVWSKKEEKKKDYGVLIVGLIFIIPSLLISFNNATFPEPHNDYNVQVIGTVRDIDYERGKVLLEGSYGDRMGYSFSDHDHPLYNNTEYIFRSKHGGGYIAESGYSIKEIYQHNNDWTWVDELYLYMGWNSDFKHNNRMIGDPTVFKGGCIET